MAGQKIFLKQADFYTTLHKYKTNRSTNCNVHVNWPMQFNILIGPFNRVHLCNEYKEKLKKKKKKKEKKERLEIPDWFYPFQNRWQWMEL